VYDSGLSYRFETKNEINKRTFLKKLAETNHCEMPRSQVLCVVIKGSVDRVTAVCRGVPLTKV